MPTTTVTPDAAAPHATTRRTVLRAAAWTAPAVSMVVAVPAYAAASGPVACADAAYEIRWASHYNAQARTATARLTRAVGSGALGTAPLTMVVSSSFQGSLVAGSTGAYSNLALSPGNVGGTGGRGLTIMQQAASRVTSLSTPRSQHRQEVTLVFSRPVSNLAFTLTDVDSLDPTRGNGQYQDRVSVSGAPSGARANQVTGAGTAGDPWRATGANVEQDPVSGSRGNVVVSYAGRPASDVYRITYWNDQTGTLASRGLQGIFLTDLTFTAASCA